MARKTKTSLQKVGSSAKKALADTGKSIAENPKSTLYIGLGIAAVFALYYGGKWFNDAFSGSGIDDTIDTTVKPDMGKTTISRATARNYASQLLEAMNWKGWMLLPYPHFGDGTDNDVLKSIFNNINADDFKLIYQEFGTKDYNGYSSPPKNVGGGIQDSLGISKKRDLVFWLRSELDFLDFSLKRKVADLVTQAGFAF